MRVADAIFARLKQETDTVYFISGGGAMYLVDALGRSGMNAVATIHEQGAGYMAIGHAMVGSRRMETTGTAIHIREDGIEVEQNAKIYHDVYQLGVCLVTSGPGSTNILSAVAAAWMDSVPVLFISGQAKTETLIGATGLRTRGVQEIDIIAMVKPITKYAYQFSMENYLIFDDIIKGAIVECTKGRPGPCWLAVPLDVQGLEV